MNFPSVASFIRATLARIDFRTDRGSASSHRRAASIAGAHRPPVPIPKMAAPLNQPHEAVQDRQRNLSRLALGRSRRGVGTNPVTAAYS